MTRLPHLNDEAVAAFADGVLRDGARARAGQHLAECPECAAAVQEQRQASYALRTAMAPALPSGLLDRLRDVPITAPLPRVDVGSGLGPDGRPVFAAYTPPKRPQPPVVGTAKLVPTLPPAPSRPVPGGTDTESGAQPRTRRGLLPGIGFGAMTAAVVVVGALASTAATAGGQPATGNSPAGTTNAPTTFIRPAPSATIDTLLVSGRR